MIGVISYHGEDHTAAVVGELKSMGKEVAEFDLGDFPTNSAMSLCWNPGAEPEYRIDGRSGSISFHEIDAVWWRRVRPFGLDPSLYDLQDRAFAESEAAQAMHGMLDALGCNWMNDRSADAAAHHKPYQWAIARQVGLRLPRTLVTNDPARARAFIDALGLGKVIFKAFLASVERWRETRLVQAEDIAKLDAVRYAPVIFQEYVPGVDLRITVVGEKLYAAEIDARASAYPVDMRMVVGEAKVQAIKLPDWLEQALLALQNRLNLEYGAIDMRRTDDGDYLFFEVNPAGQWLFAEQRAGLPVTRAVARHLCELADANRKSRRLHHQ